ncbi:MAG: hypothetical protein AAF639_16720 [Chloroflexota bacterium]
MIAELNPTYTNSRPPLAFDQEDAVPTLYCANHANKETLLRCNRCDDPICFTCAKQTDVGYRCPTCVRSLEDRFFNANAMDNPIAFVVSFMVAAVTVPIVSAVFNMFFIYGFILAFMVGPAAGGVLVQMVRYTIGRRRGRRIRHFAIAGLVVGVFISTLATLLILTIFSLPLLIFVVSASATTYRLLR